MYPLGGKSDAAAPSKLPNRYKGNIVCLSPVHEEHTSSR